MRELRENKLTRRDHILYPSTDVAKSFAPGRNAPVEQNKQINPNNRRKLLVIPAKLYPEMAKSWSTKDANRAVVAIAVILKRVGALPKMLADAYLHEIETGEITVARRFYEQLAVDCPPALDYFTETAVEARESEKDRGKGSLRTIPID